MNVVKHTNTWTDTAKTIPALPTWLYVAIDLINFDDHVRNRWSFVPICSSVKRASGCSMHLRASDELLPLGRYFLPASMSLVFRCHNTIDACFDCCTSCSEILLRLEYRFFQCVCNTTSYSSCNNTRDSFSFENTINQLPNLILPVFLPHT